MQLIWSTPWGVRRCESVRYSAFGVPTVIASGDFDGDGDEDSEDSDFILNLLAQSPVPYSVVADLDLDGDVDLDDDALQLLTSGGGRGLLSTSGVANRRGYAGYEHDWAIDSLCHVRHRAYLTDLGRWTRRDPLGYVEGMSLYAYVANRAIIGVDPMGLIRRGGERLWCADPSDPWCNSGPLPPETPIDIGSPAAGPGGGGGPPPAPPPAHWNPPIPEAIQQEPCFSLPDDPTPCQAGPSASWPPDCGNALWCYRRFQQQQRAAVRATKDCIIDNLPTIGALELACLIACAATGPFAPTCASLCGAAGSGAVLADLVFCIDQLKFRKENNRISYCSCLEWKRRHCHRDQQESAYVDCN